MADEAHRVQHLARLANAVGLALIRQVGELLELARAALRLGQQRQARGGVEGAWFVVHHRGHDAEGLVDLAEAEVGIAPARSSLGGARAPELRAALGIRELVDDGAASQAPIRGRQVERARRGVDALHRSRRADRHRLIGRAQVEHGDGHERRVVVVARQRIGAFPRYEATLWRHQRSGLLPAVALDPRPPGQERVQAKLVEHLCAGELAALGRQVGHPGREASDEHELLADAPHRYERSLDLDVVDHARLSRIAHVQDPEPHPTIAVPEQGDVFEERSGPDLVPVIADHSEQWRILVVARQQQHAVDPGGLAQLDEGDLLGLGGIFTGRIEGDAGGLDGVDRREDRRNAERSRLDRDPGLARHGR